jgi:hypothetical protein
MWQRCLVRGFSGCGRHKKWWESAHDFAFKIAIKTRTCANSRTTNLKSAYAFQVAQAWAAQVMHHTRVIINIQKQGILLSLVAYSQGVKITVIKHQCTMRISDYRPSSQLSLDSTNSLALKSLWSDSWCFWLAIFTHLWWFFPQNWDPGWGEELGTTLRELPGAIWHSTWLYVDSKWPALIFVCMLNIASSW